MKERLQDVAVFVGAMNLDSNLMWPGCKWAEVEDQYLELF